MNKQNLTLPVFRFAAKLGKVALLSFVLVFSFILRAGAQVRSISGAVDLYFPFDNAVLSESYLSNSSSLEQLDAYLASNTPDQLEVVTFSSPEGNVYYNLDLSRRRARSVQTYLETKYPALKGRIILNAGAESWDALRGKVSSDGKLSGEARTSILEIIDSDAQPDDKERSLKALPEYKRLYSSFFRNLRYASVVIPAGSASNVKRSEQGVSSSAGVPFSKVNNRPSGFAGSSDTDILFDLRSFSVNGTESNAALLEALDRLLSRISEDELKSLTIIGSASPEGPVAINERLAGSRAQNLTDLIVSRYPSLKGKIEVVNGGENWEGLRSAVQKDDMLSAQERQDILDVIDSPLSAQEKEARLRALPTYNHLFEDIFPSLRSASVLAGLRPNAALASTDTKLADAQVISGGKPSVPADMSYRSVTREYEEEEIRPIVAVSTNALYDVLITPNFAVEVPIGRQWSAYADYSFPWWVNRANDRAWQMLKLDLGGRYWISRHSKTDKMDVLNGHFVGLTGMAGYYDVEPKHEGYQGEFLAVGLEYGYAWNLGKKKKWRLEASAAAGWMGTQYRYYIGNSTDEHLLYQNNGKLNWWGPIKANISFKYIFSHKVTRRVTK